MKAPFPWFGGKSRVAGDVWSRFGNIANYVEPFFGSGANLLGRPGNDFGIETVNDKDGFVSNFWRATAFDAEAVARAADWPVNENDLHARHAWLVERRDDLTARLEGDPDYYDAKIAGWWVWGQCSYIGSGWCAGDGPWHVVDGKLVKGDTGQGIHRKLPHLGDAGRGIHRQLPHLGNAGTGIHRKRPVLGTAGRGLDPSLENLLAYFADLKTRLRGVRVCSGDWTRVLGPSPTTKHGLTGVFLDPPYSGGERDGDMYAVDSGTVAADVRAWAIEHGDDPLLRIALCGYDTEHEMPSGWSAFQWKAHGGYGSQSNGRGRANAARETIWFSPHCLNSRQGALFA